TCSSAPKICSLEPWRPTHMGRCLSIQGHELPGRWKVDAADDWAAAIAEGSEEVVGEVGMRAVATKSSLEQRSISSWVCFPIVLPSGQTQLPLDNRNNGGSDHQGDGVAMSAGIISPVDGR